MQRRLAYKNQLGAKLEERMVNKRSMVLPPHPPASSSCRVVTQTNNTFLFTCCKCSCARPFVSTYIHRSVVHRAGRAGAQTIPSAMYSVFLPFHVRRTGRKNTTTNKQQRSHTVSLCAVNVIVIRSAQK